MLSDQGEVVVGRCRSTNLCRYCQRLYVIETVEMLVLDALEWAPTLWCVLTAREHLTRADTHGHLRQLRRAARKRWPQIEWFVQVEMQRRGALHLNLLIKGVPIDQADELRALLVERWCARVDALPAGQWLEAIEHGPGVVRYLSKMLAHGLKAEQAPPIGWRGHRTSQTRGYLVRPAGLMRLEARRSLRWKRAIWKALQAGSDALAAEAIAAAALEVAEATSWRLVIRQPAPKRDVTANERRAAGPAGREDGRTERRRGTARRSPPTPASVRTSARPAPPTSAPSGAAGVDRLGVLASGAARSVMHHPPRRSPPPT